MWEVRGIFDAVVEGLLYLNQIFRPKLFYNKGIQIGKGQSYIKIVHLDKERTNVFYRKNIYGR